LLAEPVRALRSLLARAEFADALLAEPETRIRFPGIDTPTQRLALVTKLDGIAIAFPVDATRNGIACSDLRLEFGRIAQRDLDVRAGQFAAGGAGAFMDRRHADLDILRHLPGDAAAARDVVLAAVLDFVLGDDEHGIEGLVVARHRALEEQRPVE